MRQTPEKMRAYLALLRKKMNLKSLVVALAAIVVFTTTYLLILPAFTLDKEEAAQQGGIDVVAEETAAMEASDAQDEEEPVVDTEEVTDEDQPAADTEEAKDEEPAPVSKDTEKAEAGSDSNSDSGSDVKVLTKSAGLEAEGDGFTITASPTGKEEVPATTELLVSEVEKNRELAVFRKEALSALQEDSNDVTDIKEIKVYDMSLEADGESVNTDSKFNVKIEYEDGVKVEDADNLRVLTFDDKNKASVLDADENKVETKVEAAGEKSNVTEASFETEGISKVAVVEVETIEKTVITADGKTYKVTVEYGKGANIPEGSELEVKEIEKSSEQYSDYLAESREAMGFDDEVETTLARFFDITIKNGEAKVEPEEPVKVQITYEDGASVNKDDTFGIVHFADQGTEVITDINLSSDGTELTYEQSSFSVIGIVSGTFSGSNWPSSPAGNYALVVYSGTGGPYYAVDSNGGLVEVDYDSETGKVSFPEETVSTTDDLPEYLWTYYVNGGNHRLTSVKNTNNKIYPQQTEGGSALSNSTNSPAANQGYIYRGNQNNRYCVAINSEGTSLISSRVTYAYYSYTYPSNAAHFMFVDKFEEEIIGGYGTASSVILTGNSKTLRMAEVITSDAGLIDFEGFSWHSSNTSVATVTTDPDTDAPIATGVSPGTTKIIGTRLNEDGETDEVIWTVTVKDKTSNSIVFLHQPQDNSNFANQDNIRPHDGYGDTEPTNYVKFVVALADENGNIILHNGAPNVELPSGSIVPERYEFELDSTGVFAIEEDTLSGISVPGYSYAGTYAYFGWYNNTDLDNMAVVSEFKNMGRISSRYANYYSVLGFKTSRGNPQYQDYSQTAFGDQGYGYYAYNPTGVLMIVLQPVSDDIAYRTSYHNDYVPGGTARTNIVDTTRAKMTRGDWIADQYRWDWYGETIMTEFTGADLTSPADGYEFVGWFDAVDAEGNGTGNEIVGQTEDGSFFAMKDGEKIVIRQNNDFYAKWQLVRGTLTVKKEIDGNLSADEQAQLKENLRFSVTDTGTGATVKSFTGTEMAWTGKTGQFDVTGLSAATTYTVAETQPDVVGYDVETTITYPNNGDSAKVSKVAAVTVNVKNTYTKKIADISIKKVDEKTNETLDNAIFKLLDEDGHNAKHYVDGEWKNVGDLVDGSYYITVSGESGISIQGLPFGTYTLAETNAPDGYIIAENEVQFTVSGDAGGNAIITTSASNARVEESNKSQLIVTNKAGQALPHTGGIGTTIFYIIGTLLVIGCGIVLVSRKRIGSNK